MSKKLFSKFLFNLPFVLSRFFRTRWASLSYFRKAIFGYPILLLFSGVLSDPMFAMLIGGVYWLGFLGLVLVYGCRSYKGELAWMYMGLGIVLLVLCVIWLEILYFFLPHGFMKPL